MCPGFVVSIFKYILYDYIKLSLYSMKLYLVHHPPCTRAPCIDRLTHTFGNLIEQSRCTPVGIMLFKGGVSPQFHFLFL